MTVTHHNDSHRSDTDTVTAILETYFYMYLLHFNDI